MTARGVFVTGTDTGVGKTEVALALVRAWQARGQRVGAMKPVSAGCFDVGEGLRNYDAQRLHQLADSPTTYEQVNPYALEPPIAPHIAAAAAGVEIDIARVEACYSQIAADTDVVVVEGAGGWRVPLDEERHLSDIVCVLQLPVVLVVGMRLGCLNQALLTMEAIARDGLKLVGWVANSPDQKMAYHQQNVAALERRINAPLLADLVHFPAQADVRMAREIVLPAL